MSKENFLGDPMLDRVMKVTVRLARELYVTRDRLALVERLLETRGILSINDIDAYEVDASTQAQINVHRDEYISSILAPLTER